MYISSSSSTSSSPSTSSYLKIALSFLKILFPTSLIKKEEIGGNFILEWLFDSNEAVWFSNRLWNPNKPSYMLEPFLSFTLFVKNIC